MKTYIFLLICIQFVSTYPQLRRTFGDRAMSKLKRTYSFAIPLPTRILDQSDLRVQRKYAPPSRRYPIAKSTQFLCQMCLGYAVPKKLDSSDCSLYCPQPKAPPFLDLNFGRRL